MRGKTAVKLAFGWTMGMLVAGCSMGRFPMSTVDDAAMVAADDIIEVGLDRYGSITTVEFHISPNDVPADVMKVVDEKCPGGKATAAEKEYEGGFVYYEVTKEIDGREHEIMVDSMKRIHSMEIVIDKSQAPANVLTAADTAVPGGALTQVEEIRDGKDKLIEYHIKKKVNGIRYKILVSPEGKLIMKLREAMAEIEVPVK